MSPRSQCDMSQECLRSRFRWTAESTAIQVLGCLPWPELSQQGLVGQRCTAQAFRSWSWPRSRLRDVRRLWDRFSHLVAKRSGDSPAMIPCPLFNRGIACRQVRRCLDLLRKCLARTASETQLRSIHLFCKIFAIAFSASALSISLDLLTERSLIETLGRVTWPRFRFWCQCFSGGLIGKCAFSSEKSGIGMIRR